jgi:hypothetical protein
VPSKFVVLIAMCAAAIVPASANADVFFKTPSDNIVCQTSRGALQCSVLSDRRGPNLPVYFLRRRGKPYVQTVTGDPAFTVPVLGYGRSKRLLGGVVRCTSRKAGLTCRNRRGHGYFLSRGRKTLF